MTKRLLIPSLICLSIASQASAPKCVDLLRDSVRLSQKEPSDDSDKPQNRTWVQRKEGVATFDPAFFIKEVEQRLPHVKKSLLSLAIVVNGVEQTQRYAWDSGPIVVHEPSKGQIDYYLVAKQIETDSQGNIQRDASGRALEKIISISDVNIRETHDSQSVESSSFAHLLKNDRKLGVQLPSNLRSRGIDPHLTQRALEIGYSKVVWVLRPGADPALSEFIEKAPSGVTIELKVDPNGSPEKALVTDRESRQTKIVDAKNFFFKVDAAFNGNAFFWDDMLVSLSTVAHDPALVRSTLEFWLEVQNMNKGVVPREVRKSNLKSLWYSSIIRAGEAPKANLQYTNPYLTHWVAEKLMAMDPSAENTALMKKVVASMEQYTRWMEKNRSVYNQGQFVGFTANALGSGLDNSRGSRGNNHSPDSYKSAWVDPLAQQISMYKSIERWQTVFLKQNDPQTQQKLTSLHTHIAELENLLNTKYWNQELGFYFDLIPDDGKGLKQDTQYHSVAGFWPLFSGSASPAQVSRMIQLQLTPEHFGGPFPFPANSLHSLRLDPKEDGYWDRDARWPSMAAISIEGLRTSGRLDVAYEMSVRFLKSMTESNPNTVAEFYGLANKLDPSQSLGRVGAHGGHETRLDFAGWGKVPPVYLMLEHIIGLEPQLNGKLVWNLLIPMEIGESLEVNNYMYHGSLIKKLSLQKVAPDQFTITVSSEKPVSIELRSFRDSRNQLESHSHSVQVQLNQSAR
jgi:hypothetical protein